MIRLIERLTLTGASFFLMTSCADDSFTMASLPAEAPIDVEFQPMAYHNPGVPQQVIDICAEMGQCKPAIQTITKLMGRREALCVDTDLMVWKATNYQDVVNLEAIAQSLGIEESVPIRSQTPDFCAGLFDPEITYIEICLVDEPTTCWPGAPQPLVLTKNESVSVTHLVHCSNRFCTGDVIWNIPMGPEGQVASVDQGGTIVANTSGTATLFGVSLEFANIATPSQIYGSVELVVGDGVQIMFLAYNGIATICNYYGVGGCSGERLPDFADDFFDRLKQLLEEKDFEVSLARYSTNPARADPDPVNRCFDPSKRATLPEILLPFTRDKTMFSQAFLAISEECDLPEDNPWGTSVYSGIRTALGADWSDEAQEKIIVLFGAKAACYVQAPNGGLCDAEPDTQIARDEIIQEANDAGIRIFAVHSTAFRSFTHDPSLLEGPNACGVSGSLCRQWFDYETEFKAIASGTGGRYYPSSYLIPLHGLEADFQVVLQRVIPDISLDVK